MTTYEYRTFIDSDKITYLKKIRELNYDAKLIRPEEINKFFTTHYHMDKLAEEYLYLVAVNAALDPIGIFELSHGSVNKSLVIVRDIFVKLCLCGATAFILVHNHPSKCTQPSDNDLLYTGNIKQAANLMDIPFLDHIIIGDDYFSFKEEGYLD